MRRRLGKVYLVKMNTVSTLALQLIFARVQTRSDRSAVMLVCRRWHDCGRRYAYPPLAYMMVSCEGAQDTMCELWTHSREWLARTDTAARLCLKAVVQHVASHRNRSTPCLACNHTTELVHMLTRNSRRRESLLDSAISWNAASCVRLMLPYVTVTQNWAVHWLTLASKQSTPETLNVLMADTRIVDPCDFRNTLVYVAALHDQGHLVGSLLGERRYDNDGIRKTLETYRTVTQLYEQYPWNTKTQDLALLWAAEHNAVDTADRALTCRSISRWIMEQAIDTARNHGYVHLCQLLEEATARNADSTA